MRGSIACLDGLHSHTTRMRLPVDPRHAWMAHRRDIESSGGTSPSVEGLPRQGRGEAGKGRGPRVAQQRVGRRAKRASRPAPDKEKGLPKGSPFSLSGGEGGDCRVHPCTRPFRATRSRASLRLSGSAPAEPSNPVGGSHPPASEMSITTTTACISRTLAKKKAAQWAAFFFIWRRGGDSNPRGAINACLISSQVHSTTLPPLRVVPGGPGTRIIRGSEADDK